VPIPPDLSPARQAENTEDRTVPAYRLGTASSEGFAPGEAGNQAVSPLKRKHPAMPVDDDRAPDWDTAACRDQDPELFFPIGSGAAEWRQIEQAKKVCARCVVVRRCLQWAVAGGIDEGVWGGHSPPERRALRRTPDGQQARATSCRTVRR
jgi:WhiB family redox-sensing transcriptional regulator